MAKIHPPPKTIPPKTSRVPKNPLCLPPSLSASLFLSVTHPSPATHPHARPLSLSISLSHPRPPSLSISLSRRRRDQLQHILNLTQERERDGRQSNRPRDQKEERDKECNRPRDQKEERERERERAIGRKWSWKSPLQRPGRLASTMAVAAVRRRPQSEVTKGGPPVAVGVAGEAGDGQARPRGSERQAAMADAQQQRRDSGGDRLRQCARETDDDQGCGLGGGWRPDHGRPWLEAAAGGVGCVRGRPWLEEEEEQRKEKKKEKKKKEKRKSLRKSI